MHPSRCYQNNQPPIIAGLQRTLNFLHTPTGRQFMHMPILVVSLCTCLYWQSVCRAWLVPGQPLNLSLNYWWFPSLLQCIKACHIVFLRIICHFKWEISHLRLSTRCAIRDVYKLVMLHFLVVYFSFLYHFQKWGLLAEMLYPKF